MKALLLDDIPSVLEQDLQAGGLTLAYEYSAPLEELAAQHGDAEVLIIRSRMRVDAHF